SAHLCLIPTPYQPRSTLFPYTTLFRSAGRAGGQRGSAEVALLGRSRSSERVPYASPIGSTSCSQGAPHRSGGEIHYRITGSSQRSEEHTSELQSLRHLVCRLLLENKKK